MVGAHASFTLSDDTLAACAEVSREAGAGIHIHVAESAADQRDALARSGRRVVERLGEAGALGPQSLLAHCVHVDDAEAGLVRRAGAAVAHNPRSNMNNGVGHAPVGKLGRRVALGTDGLGADMFLESRAAYLRLREEDLSLGPAWALERVNQGAVIAEGMRFESQFGVIRDGWPTDLVVLDYPAPTPVDDETITAHWVFGLEARHVRDVVVDGELVVEDRRLTRLDQDKVAADAVSAAGRLWRRLGAIPPHPFAPEGDG
jgi:cytosine/adenosine deaminase-related metal-dependent hydrolase